jgi:hypothetical protein
MNVSALLVIELQCGVPSVPGPHVYLPTGAHDPYRHPSPQPRRFVRLLEPGVKTGSFRLGTDVLITDVNGNSEISGGDYATAFVDEIDKPVSAAW